MSQAMRAMAVHHQDELDDMRIKLRTVLEGELRDVLLKAVIANSKLKTQVTAYQLDDALSILERELNKLGE